VGLAIQIAGSAGSGILMVFARTSLLSKYDIVVDSWFAAYPPAFC